MYQLLFLNMTQLLATTASKSSADKFPSLSLALLLVDMQSCRLITTYPTLLNRKMLNLEKGLIQKIQPEYAVYMDHIKLGIP